MNLKRWVAGIARMPIKLKLTFGSAALLALLFLGYNSLQYMLMEKWIIHREESAVQRGMNEILNYVLERESGFAPAELADIRHYLEKVNRDDQRIRILDKDGEPVVTVTNRVPQQWVEPETAAREQTIVLRDGERSLLIMRSPFTIFEFEGTVEIVKSMTEFEALIATISRVMFLFTAAAVALSVLVGWLLSWRLLKPLQAMASTIRSIKSKGLQERMVPATNGDEIATLIHLFNEMMDQVEESFRQQSRFVEDASHELRTPIAIIEGHLNLLRRWGKEEPAVLEESLAASLHEFARLRGLVLELLALSRAEKSELDFADIVEEAEAEVRAIVSRAALVYPDCRLETELEALRGIGLPIAAAHLEQVLLIVIDNAVKYSLDRKVVRISAEREGERMCLRVTDRGMGIPSADLPYVTNRFYRVDKARSRDQGGNGLGLAIAKRLIERYDGELALASVENEGTTVSIRLPCRPSAERIGEPAAWPYSPETEDAS